MRWLVAWFVPSVHAAMIVHYSSTFPTSIYMEESDFLTITGMNASGYVCWLGADGSTPSGTPTCYDESEGTDLDAEDCTAAADLTPPEVF